MTKHQKIDLGQGLDAVRSKVDGVWRVFSDIDGAQTCLAAGNKLKEVHKEAKKLRREYHRRSRSSELSQAA